MKLSSIAYALRFGNLTEQEEAIYLPFSYQNIPHPIKTEKRIARRFGRGEQPTFEETIEIFQDGSFFAKVS